jgi:hypothetical protein
MYCAFLELGLKLCIAGNCALCCLIITFTGNFMGSFLDVLDDFKGVKIVTKTGFDYLEFSKGFRSLT